MYKKVMIIDDSFLDRFVAEKIIKTFHFANEIIVYESAKEGLDYLSAHAGNIPELPEIIFLDIRMPVIDGFGFLERFESMPLPVKQHCIIIMLTSSIDPDDIKRAYQYKSVYKFFIKPLDEEKLNGINVMEPIA